MEGGGSRLIQFKVGASSENAKKSGGGDVITFVTKVVIQLVFNLKSSDTVLKVLGGDSV